MQHAMAGLTPSLKHVHAPSPTCVIIPNLVVLDQTMWRLVGGHQNWVRWGLLKMGAWLTTETLLPICVTKPP